MIKSKKSAIPECVIDLLSKKYNILAVTSFFEFDLDYEALKEQLLLVKKEVFDVNDRIIVEHTETDFYFEHCDVGLNLMNFFTIVDMLDIPRYVFLFYSSHFGIKQEIEKFCKHSGDQPTIIESFIDKYHYSPSGYKDVDLQLDQITHNALCMMRVIRSHRKAVCHVINDIPDNVLVRAINLPRK